MASTDAETHLRPVEEHVDVLIVGGGLSGIGAACHLQRKRPELSFLIVEARDAIGGTWDLFRYPGIRSDSDMFTLGYSFKPWEDPKALADGPSIRSYISEAATENALVDRVRLRTKALRAEWSSERSQWSVELEGPGDRRSTVTCSFLYGCTGYYSYDEPYTPDFPGIERFGGTVVHPQHWPEDLDYAGKRVVVIGSGATAVTLVPAMAGTAEHVTMLQRSPSYVLSLPDRDPLGDLARRWLPVRAAYSFIRWKNALMALGLFTFSRKRPELMRRLLRRATQRQLPAGYDVDTHFNPSYDPWDQRMCLVPEGDLFRAISSGEASVVTGAIDAFTETGLLLTDGRRLDADIVITATGLKLLAFGGIELAVDGRDVELAGTVGYKGMMLSGVPNFAFAVGYTNASWTLKADLVSEYVCRLLGHMRERGYDTVTPVAPDPSQPTQPFLDLASGYVERSVQDFPRQGTVTPWRLNQSYPRDVRLLRHGPIEDAGVRFSRGPGASAARPEQALAA